MEMGLVFLTTCTYSLTHASPIYLLLARLVFYMEMVRFGNIKGDKPRLGSIMADPA